MNRAVSRHVSIRSFRCVPMQPYRRVALPAYADTYKAWNWERRCVPSLVQGRFRSSRPRKAIAETSSADDASNENDESLTLDALGIYLNDLRLSDSRWTTFKISGSFQGSVAGLLRQNGKTLRAIGNDMTSMRPSEEMQAIAYIQVYIGNLEKALRKLGCKRDSMRALTIYNRLEAHYVDAKDLLERLEQQHQSSTHKFINEAIASGRPFATFFHFLRDPKVWPTLLGGTVVLLGTITALVVYVI